MDYYLELVFIDHNLKLSPNRGLLKWCFPKVATLRWQLILRPQESISFMYVSRSGRGLSIRRQEDTVGSMRK
jgi:hypothetical protein